MQNINRELLSQSARDALETFTNETGLVIHHIVARNEQWELVMVDVDPETSAEQRYRERESAAAAGAQG